MSRHPGVEALMRFLRPNPNLGGAQATIAADCHVLAIQMLNKVPDSPELTEGLRKLLEAKDCFVRASLPAEVGE